MLVAIGLCCLPVLVLAQEIAPRVGHSAVESLPLQADVSYEEVYTGILKLFPSSTAGINLTIQSYWQEVTLKSTLINVEGDIQEGTWQSKVIEAARSVDLGNIADDVTWDWAASALRPLDSSTVVAKLVMTWTPDVLTWTDLRAWGDMKATRSLQDSQFATNFATEIRHREAADDADATVQTPVITTISVSVDVAFPHFETALSEHFDEETSTNPESDEAGGSIKLGDDSGASTTVIIVVAIVAAVICICCVYSKFSGPSDALKGATEPNLHATHNSRTTSQPAADVSVAAVADEPITAYGQSVHADAPEYSRTLASGRAPARDTEAGGQATVSSRQRTTQAKAATLAEAIYRGDAAAISKFTHDVNEKVQGSFTPLYIASRNNDVASAKQLLLHGADVNACTRGGSTALCRAAQGGNAEVLKVLLEHPNVEINKQRGAGRTALFLAVQNGHQQCVQLLLDNGAATDLCVLDSTSQTKWTAQQFADRRAGLTVDTIGDAKTLPEAGLQERKTIAAMLRACSVDDAQPTSHSAVSSGSSLSESVAVAAGAGAGAAATAVKTAVPPRDHCDMEDSASDYSDPGSTGATRRTASTENRLASLMSAGVMAATASTAASNLGAGANFSRTASQLQVVPDASGAKAPIVPPRAATRTGVVRSDSDTSSSNSDSSSGSDLVHLDERPIPLPRAQTGVVTPASMAVTAAPQVPPREQQLTSPSGSSGSESGAPSSLPIFVVLVHWWSPERLALADDSSWGDEGNISLGI